MKRLDSDVGANHQHAINPFFVSAEEMVLYKYKPRLYGNFETSEDFLNTIEVLERASEDDVVELHINSGGGSADALSTLIHAMKKCAAKIVVIFTGTIASAATFPLFYCDEFEIADDCSFLFHEAICGAPPETMSASRDFTRHTYEALERLLRNTYQGFFSDEEFSELLAGKQFWMFPDEVLERFTIRNERMEAMMQEAQCGECSRDMYECSCGMTAENQIPVSPEKEAEIDKSLGIVRKPRKPTTKQKEE